MVKNDSRPFETARISRRTLALMSLMGLVVPPAVAAAQETEDDVTTDVLAEVPTTGASRLGPVTLSASRVSAPEPEPEPEPVEGVAPIELQVDKIGLYGPIEIGTIVDGAMQDPSGPWVVAWYDQLGKVGERDNVVMAGHVDYYTVGPAIFWEVPNLTPGDVIRVICENGENFEYAMEWTELFDVATELTPEVIQNDIVGETGQESLTLITCGGDFDPATGQYLQRWVLRANQM